MIVTATTFFAPPSAAPLPLGPQALEAVTALEGVGLSVLWLVLIGVLLVGLLATLRAGLALVPLSRRRREFVTAAAPMVAGLTAFAYLLYALRILFADYPQYMPLVWSFAALLVVGASWFAVRDIVSGVLLRSGRVCKVGDRVTLAGVEGVIQHMGLRLMAIEEDSGSVALVPYAKVAAGSVVRAPSRGDVLPHAFRVKVPPSVSMSEARSTLRLAISHCHWASLVREPELSLLTEGAVDVTVFSIAAERSAEIEAAARASIARLGQRSQLGQLGQVPKIKP